MNRTNSRPGSQNRVKGALIASASLLAIIFFAVPWIGEYFDLRHDAAELITLETELAEVHQRQDVLDRVEQKLESELEHFLSQNTDEENIESVRETLIEIVRSSRARLRRLEISTVEPRVWSTQNDDARNASMPLYGEDSGFVLHCQVVELQADGSLKAIREILRGVTQHGWLMTTEVLSTMPTGVRETPMNLQLRLVLYGLTPAKTVLDGENDSEPEEFARSRETRQMR